MAALEAEVENYLQAHRDVRDGDGRRLVVRNGNAAVRRVQTGLGTLEVQAPRVDDRRENERFTSRIAASTGQPSFVVFPVTGAVSG